MHSSIYFSIYTFFFFSPMFPVFNISWELNLPFIYWPYCLFTFWPVNEPLSGLCCLVLALRANFKKKKKKRCKYCHMPRFCFSCVAFGLVAGTSEKGIGHQKLRVHLSVWPTCSVLFVISAVNYGFIFHLIL